MIGFAAFVLLGIVRLMPNAQAAKRLGKPIPRIWAILRPLLALPPPQDLLP